MTEEKLVELVDKLLEKTIAGAQNWEATPSGGEFLTSFPRYSVKLSQWLDKDEQEHVTQLSIFNQSGDEIERKSSSELATRLGQWGIQQRMADLYEAARRRAFNVDSAIDDLLSSL